MIERPLEYSITNTTIFEGHILVDGPDTAGVGFGRNNDKAEAWLPFLCDLRRVTEVKQRAPDDDSAVLYTKHGFLATVNASIGSLRPFWIEARTGIKPPPAP